MCGGGRVSVLGFGITVGVPVAIEDELVPLAVWMVRPAASKASRLRVEACGWRPRRERSVTTISVAPF